MTEGSGQVVLVQVNADVSDDRRRSDLCSIVHSITLPSLLSPDLMAPSTCTGKNPAVIVASNTSNVIHVISVAGSRMSSVFNVVS